MNELLNPGTTQRRPIAAGPRRFSSLLTRTLSTVLLAASASFALAAARVSLEQPAGTLLGGAVSAWGANDQGVGQTAVPANLAGVKAIAVGAAHTLALKGDGTIVSWGGNGYDQTTIPANLGVVTAIAAGGNSSFAVKADGTVVRWGDDFFGTPTVPTTLTDVAALSAGMAHVLALRNDKTVTAWGDSASGQTTIPANLADVTAIAAGDFHSVALKSDGTVVAWGTVDVFDSNFNVIGTEPAPAAKVPNGLSGVKAIAAGGGHTLALKTDGTVVAWGDNSSGQTTLPANLSNVVAIGAGGTNSVAVKADGTVVVWGNTGTGQGTIPAAAAGAVAVTAGNSFLVALSKPTVAFGGQGVSTASAAKTFTIKNTGDAALSITSATVSGGNAGDFAVNSSGLATSVAAAGQTTFSVTFTPGAVGPRTTTLRVQTGDLSRPVYEITLTGSGTNGAGPTIAIEQPAGTPLNKAMYAWGDNSKGQTTIPAAAQSGVQALAAGFYHTVALKTDGSVVAWGDNEFGQLNVPTAARSGVKAIAIGGHGYITYALKTDGSVIAWGESPHGSFPVPAALSSGVKAIAANRYYAAVLKTDGSIITWGQSIVLPVTVSGQSEVTAIATSGLVLWALRADGSVFQWTPARDGTELVGHDILGGVTAIAAGEFQLAALRADGSAYLREFKLRFIGRDAEGTWRGVQALASGTRGVVLLNGDGSTGPWQDDKFFANIPAAASRGLQLVTTGTDHTVALVHRNISFPRQLVDTASAAKTFKIKNSGGSALTITGVNLTGLNAADFSVDTSAMATSVPPGGETTFSVTFTPTKGGTRAASVHVLSDDGTERDLEVRLFGEGLGSSDAKLASLDAGEKLFPSFSPTVTKYTAAVPFATNSVVLKPTASDAKATITVNGATVGSGGTSAAIPLAVGANTITTVVSASDGKTTRTYTVTITRASPPNPVLPVVTTGEATGESLTGATLQGTVNAQGSLRTITFEYGTTPAYGSSVTATPGTLATSSVTPVSGTLTGLAPHTLYHFRTRAAGDFGTAFGADETFVTGNTAPVAAADDLKIVQASSVLDVLSNDADADGDRATFSVAAIATALPKSAGKLKLAKGSLIFTASKEFLAGTASPATFSYTMTDGFGGTSTATVTLTYNASSLTIQPETKQISAEGETYPLSVVSSGPWTATGAPSWATITPTIGFVGDPVTVTVQPNTGKKSRTGVIKIGSATHTITQAGVDKPVIGPLASTEYSAIIGGSFSLAIPTENGPVTYKASGLPKGLTLSNTTGMITGVPTATGDFAVTVTAKNANAAADDTLAFTIRVAPLATGVVGTFHGLIERSSELNQVLGSRIEVTTTDKGAYTGKIITGTKATSIRGLLTANVAAPERARLLLPIPALGATLDLTFDDTTDAFTGTLGDDADNAAEVNGWRNAWAGIVGKAEDVAGTYSFQLKQIDPDSGLPQGLGFGTFTVDEKTGALKLDGSLPDGSDISGSTFVGQDGQVLIYVPLYGAKGSLAGVLTLNSDHTISGSPDWYKPAAEAKSKDNAYRDGFGPLPLDADGGLYAAPAKDELVLNLTAGDNNAVLSFLLGGLDTESAEFDQSVTITAAGVANKVTIATPLNDVKVAKFDAKTGAFSGKFTLGGIREASFSGQIVSTFGGVQGVGYFLLPQVPGSGETAKTAPILSGQVTLKAAGPR